MRRSNSDFSQPSFIVRWRYRRTGTRTSHASNSTANGDKSFPKSHGSIKVIMEY